MTTRAGAVTRFALAAGAAVALVALVLPRASGAQWHDIAGALSRPSAAQLAALGVLWLAGLWVHTPSLTAALPGLSHRRALLLNLSGSFVSNLLPLGGAAGTVVNWRMARTWGFSSGAFSRWAVVTNLADTVVKLALPGVVLCWFAFGSTAPPRTVGTAAAVGAGLLVVTVIGVALVARDDRALRRAGRWADRAAVRVRAIPRAPEGYGERAARFRSDSARLVRDGWGRMLGGKLGYAALQALLLWACLRVVGGPVAPLVVASAFVVERVLSMVVVTPGATGVVEVGMAGVLGALGAQPAAAAAGVLLYRGLVVGMEVPVGGLALLGWWVGHRRAGNRLPDTGARPRVGTPMAVG
jgi:putative heme transporter